ncbi:hypothetical protein B9N43_16325 [Denitratisoma sp. DHT3]|nr:hypothetical protein B9N43_16325 [Denitratisoma sp. DHT3]
MSRPGFSEIAMPTASDGCFAGRPARFARLAKKEAMKTRIALGCAATMISLSALAGPAPWYLWGSKVNGDVICAQTSPGEGWVRAGGPFRDAHCKIPI